MVCESGEFVAGHPLIDCLVFVMLHRCGGLRRLAASTLPFAGERITSLTIGRV